jgi:deoxycytidine triphosphate deaminase
MFINPKTAITNGWIQGIKNEALQVQPNAIDFTLDQVFSINLLNAFIISEAGKQMRGGGKVLPIEQRDGTGEFWNLEGASYDCLSDMYVEIPEGVAAILVPRSTFTRNGLFIASGLYDSGFKGHIGFVLHNPARTKIGVGTRIGQIIFVSSENAKLYAGGYNHEAGTVAPHQE